jgi:pimeloyl-ACP methyl ester carboxylesterase/DNA-binding CsgD family transcriptional regulator
MPVSGRRWQDGAALMTSRSDDLAPLLEGIHNIVVAPDRLEALLDIWTERLHLGNGVAGGFNLFDDPGIAVHVEQAEFALRNVIESVEAARPPVIEWVNGVRSAAVAVTRAGYVVAANQSASDALELFTGCSVGVFGLEAEDHSILLAELGSIRLQQTGTPRLLRLRRPRPAAPLVIRLVDGIADDPFLVGLVTTVITWPDGLSDLVQRMFELTASEAGVLKDLALGQTVKEMAASSGRSEPTIRSHLSALLAKTETRSQVELIRMTLGLLEVVEPRTAQTNPAMANGSQGGVGPSTLILADQRRLDYLVIGQPKGAPFILMPGGVGTSPFPPKDEQELYGRGLRMIIPIRAGYGGSSPIPPGSHVHDVAAGDTFALMDHLGIDRAPFVTICDDFRIAIALAEASPERMAAILGCGAPLPATTHEHFSRMSKWSRFVSANARFAPRALPYVAMAFFSLVRRLGPKRFLQTVMADSPADLRLIENDDVMSALARSSEVAVSPNFTAHIAWGAEVAANLSIDWSENLRRCRVPITLFAGHEDPFSPFETVKEYAVAMPHIRLLDFPACGQLLYPYSNILFDTIEQCLRTDERDATSTRLYKTE